MFYSQYGQDKWVFENCFNNKLSGTFLEVGADDGVDKSNTLFFEKEMGWTGLCIEPSPVRFKLLENNRECICENIAVSDFTGEAEFLDIEGWGKGLSGLVAKYCENHKRRINQELSHSENKGSSVIKVKVDNLQTVLERNNLSTIDFCTIDTEGGELEILKTLDFNKTKIHILCVENNYNNPEVRDFLENKGYVLIKRIKIDEIYERQQDC